MEYFRVGVSGLAAEMLEVHALYLSQYSEDGPKKFKYEFYKKLDGLDFMPRRYSRVYDDDETMGELRKAWFYHNRYAIIFSIKGDVITVEHVIDGRMDNSWLMDL